MESGRMIRRWKGKQRRFPYRDAIAAGMHRPQPEQSLSVERQAGSSLRIAMQCSPIPEVRLRSEQKLFFRFSNPGLVRITRIIQDGAGIVSVLSGDLQL